MSDVSDLQKGWTDLIKLLSGSPGWFFGLKIRSSWFNLENYSHINYDIYDGNKKKIKQYFVLK